MDGAAMTTPALHSPGRITEMETWTAIVTATCKPRDFEQVSTFPSVKWEFSLSSLPHRALGGREEMTPWL